VLTESTRARRGSGLALDDLGVRPLKNVDQPIRIFRLRES